MYILTYVESFVGGDTYSGTQTLPAEEGEYIFTGIFRYSHFRIIVYGAEGQSVRFRLMDGAISAHEFVLNAGETQSCTRDREGEDYYYFEFKLTADPVL